MLLAASLVIYIPLGLLDAIGDQIEHVEVEKLDFFTSLLLLGALAQFAAAALGDQFYAGFVAAAVIEARARDRRHRILEIALTLPYGRLIVADLVITTGTTLGLALLIVPGIVFFTWFAVTTPVIKIERLGLRAAFLRSRRLVRGSFWPVFLLLGGLYFVSNLLTSTAQDLAIRTIGDEFLGEWLAAVAMGVAVGPIVAVATVVVALELIGLHRSDGAAESVAG